MKAGCMLVSRSMEERLADVVLRRCDALAECTDQEGMILRTFLSPAMERCMQMVRGWMEEAGMQVGMDTVGNLHGVLASRQEHAQRLMIASHLDSVPNAGRYDGVLGVMLGIALVEAAREKELSFDIEVVGFSDEEGVRYGLPFIGSRAVCGALDAKHLRLLDADSGSLGDALAEFSTANPEAMPCGVHTRTRGYLELHIEQGPALDDAGVGLAVVEAIAGQSRATVTFKGQAGHAGTTPMALRRDALTAAAEWLLAVETKAQETPRLVASTGRIECEPGATNVIAGMVRCSLDVRSASDAVRAESLRWMLAEAGAIATRRSVGCSSAIDVEHATVPMDLELTRLAARSVYAGQGEAMRIVSGAGHDAMMIASRLPAAMIFLRSPGGVSHHPDEAVLACDVADALRAGTRFLDGFEDWLESEASACRS